MSDHLFLPEKYGKIRVFTRILIQIVLYHIEQIFASKYSLVFTIYFHEIADKSAFLFHQKTGPGKTGGFSPSNHHFADIITIPAGEYGSTVH